MLRRDPLEGARRSVDEIYNRNRALFFLVETVVLHVTSNVGGCPHRIAAAVFGGGCGHGGGGGVEFYFHKLRFGCATEPVCHVSKRVGLTGFKCRCGLTFCGAHRYSEKHACGFDFKTVGREEIARANPVIKAEKLRRI
uniref:AN1-type domain-containing protein n=1 Tax=Glycine max TaxID=3847 RepID=C6T7H4_SOYBN|nr:unknown [Glycine max]